MALPSRLGPWRYHPDGSCILAKAGCFDRSAASDAVSACDMQPDTATSSQRPKSFLISLTCPTISSTRPPAPTAPHRGSKRRSNRHADTLLYIEQTRAEASKAGETRLSVAPIGMARRPTALAFNRRYSQNTPTLVAGGRRTKSRRSYQSAQQLGSRLRRAVRALG